MYKLQNRSKTGVFNRIVSVAITTIPHLNIVHYVTKNENFKNNLKSTFVLSTKSIVNELKCVHSTKESVISPRNKHVIFVAILVSSSVMYNVFSNYLSFLLFTSLLFLKMENNSTFFFVISSNTVDIIKFYKLHN